ncbi:unnamed protein product [Hermetia illucens]|uniref:Peroxidase n=1 Tax=Hermetia illucens TaxID=343691 RepID=A0A7R8UDT8_HERIL|nr:uncharacterized protein LOC119659737 [Hermetia illucens]CAD7078943.1 unnamed protein product [Hermetia illucens]
MGFPGTYLLCCIYLLGLVYYVQPDATPSDLRAAAKAALLREKENNLQPCNETTTSLPVCPPSKFRSATGECNNILHRSWGSRGDVFLRLLEANYANGFNQPRSSVGSHALPDGEDIINLLQKHTNSKAVHPHITAMLPAWGQLLAYDLVEITQTATQARCCNQKENPTMTPDEMIQCYVRLGEGCREYKRSAPSLDPDNCHLTRRDQMNVASGYIDGSGLYGATEKEFQGLRTFLNGKVDIKSCPRCNQPGAVGALHTALLQEHNRITDVLLGLNPSWNDATLFFEARRIVTNQIQHITYNEFLPILLGQEITNRDGLRLLSGKHFSGYSSINRAGVFNEFAVGAMPAFLTILPEEMLNEKSSAASLIEVPALMKSFVPPNFERTEWSPIALAIQRGRDHGIPSYRHALHLCDPRFSVNNSEPLTFEAFKRISNLGDEPIALLQKLFQDPEDVDLIVGALLENAAPGTVFGPTISCIMALQFTHVRTSDRFWYENDIPPSSLSIEQLQSIRKTSLSGLLCSSSGVSRSQPKAFFREDIFLNAGLPCEQLPGIDLTPWKVETLEQIEVENYMSEPTKRPEELEELNDELIKAAVEKAKEDLIARRKFEYEAWLQQGGIDARSPDGTAASFSKANRNALLLANSSLIYELASNEILNTLHRINRKKRQTFDNSISVFNRDDLSETLQTIDINSFISGSISPLTLEPQCEDFSIACDPSGPFRSMSGHCNNLRNPTLGQSLTTFNRLLPAVYEDGISRPRISSVTGAPLPNPRVISTLVHPDISNLHTRYSLMVMQYAQFLDHDLTMTPIHKGFHESIPSCRKCDSPRTVHPECNPFPVPPGDHFYPEINVTSGERLCFPFMRSLPGQQNLGPRDQINQNTAFLDASQIYGENNCVANKLRGFSGRLNSTIHPIKGKELLPQTNSHPECKSPSGLCFEAGDGRASEQPGLTSIHNTFLREHNRIVEGLRGVNPHWNGDQLFQHARRIIIAQTQHITYNEFLPRLLSWNAVNLYGLKLLPQGYYKDYDPTCNPSIFTEFASACFRIGHSLLRPHIPRLSPNHQPVDPPLLLRDGFFKMDQLLQPGIMDEISRGLVATPMESLDQFITGEVTNHLFEDTRIPFSGIDLVALNVQRARDHGIPSYNNYRALCNLKRAHTWDDLSREIPPEVITRFKKIYATVDDIDLFPGAMSERPLQGGLVGPTLACVIGIQFRQLRKCDRFWYETENPDLRFTEAQLAELRKTTLAKIICENLEIPGDMQRAAFDLPSNFLNPRVPCQSMPQIDLSAWRENIQGCQIGNRQVRIGDSAFPSPCTSCVCTVEGPQCASLRITNCAQLAREWPRDAILRDDVCSAQCGSVLQNGNGAGFSNIAGLNPPPSRVSRSRPQNTLGFKLPDLTPFIASL